jgi:hypothetical protein
VVLRTTSPVRALCAPYANIYSYEHLYPHLTDLTDLTDLADLTDLTDCHLRLFIRLTCACTDMRAAGGHIF